MLSAVRRTDLALPAGLWIIPLSCSRFMADQSKPFHARSSRSSVTSNRVAPKRHHRPCLHRSPCASLVINGHPISTLLPPNDGMHPPHLFSSTYCLRFDTSRSRRGAEHDRRGRRDSDRRIPADGGQTASGRRRQAMVRMAVGGRPPKVVGKSAASRTRPTLRSGGRD